MKIIWLILFIFVSIYIYNQKIVKNDKNDIQSKIFKNDKLTKTNGKKS